MNDYEHPIAIHTVIQYMQKWEQYRTNPRLLENLTTAYHAEWKITNREDDLPI